MFKISCVPVHNLMLALTNPKSIWFLLIIKHLSLVSRVLVIEGV